MSEVNSSGVETETTQTAEGTSTGVAQVRPEELRHFHLAYARLKPTLDAIPPGNAARVVLDIGFVVQSVLGVLPEVSKFKEAILHECPRVNANAIADVREAALALGHLEVLKRGSKGQPPGVHGDPAAQVRELRDVLWADVQPLVARGLLDEKALLLTPGNSPRNVAFDTLRLVNYLDENWPVLQGRSLATQGDLEAARSAAQDLITYLGVRDNTEGDEELALTRQRAMTHLVARYEELRWAIRYVRRDAGDADLIMPSLYSMRSKRSAPSASNTEVEEATDHALAAPVGVAGEIDVNHLQAVMAGSWPSAVTKLGPNADHAEASGVFPAPAASNAR